MRKIKTWRDPYCRGVSLCRPVEIEIQPGLTVLVGCNGAGKTTLLNNIQEFLEKEEVPVVFFNNQTQGGSNAIASAMYDDINFGAALWTASEGEAIQMNIGKLMKDVRQFIQTGKLRTKYDGFSDALREAAGIDPKEEKKPSKERWLLFDATDSGYSIDNVIEMKDLFDIIIKDAKETFGVEAYIIISANEYELARGSACFDVNAGKYLEFKDYEDYRKFILANRERKDKRLAKENEKAEKNS